jgi:uncharacterized cupredoxin-like copper-binding protein
MEAFREMKRNALVPLVMTIAAALAVTGCGSKKKSSAPSAAPPPTSTPTNATPTPAAKGQTLTLSAVPSGQFKFDKSSLTAKAGNVTLKMSNPSSVTHGIAVKGYAVDKQGPQVNKGATSTVTVNLKPGTYTFYCPVPGHEQGGMKGTLTVK